MENVFQSNKRKYIINASVGLLITFGLFFYINYEEMTVRRQLVEQQSLDTKNTILSELKKVDLVLEALSFIMENTPNMTNELFNSYTDTFIKDLYGIEALEWAPRVLYDEKENFETEGKLRHGESFYIKTHDENNQLIKPKDKAQYFPIEYINPVITNEKMIGFDISSNDVRNNSVVNSYTYKIPSYTRPIKLVLGGRDSFGFLAMKYVEATSNNPEGVLAGVYSMDSFVENILDLNGMDVIVDIYDVKEGDESFYSSDLTYREYHYTKDVIEYKINVADRIWRITFSDKNGYQGFPHLYESYIVFLLGVFITYFMFYTSYKSHVNQFKYAAELEKSNVELSDLNRQKDVLLKEVHHRVKNNMQSINSLLSMQSRYIESEEIKNVFDNSKGRVLSMAMVHEMLYKSDNIGKIDCEEYTKNLIKKIIISFKGYEHNVKCNFNIGSFLFNADTSIPLGLIITEIVTNSLKYGYGNNEVINFELFMADDSNICMFISDNGPGFDFEEEVKKNTLGLKLISRLISQLNGTFNVESSSIGTCYNIFFKEI